MQEAIDALAQVHNEIEVMEGPPRQQVAPSFGAPTAALMSEPQPLSDFAFNPAQGLEPLGVATVTDVPPPPPPKPFFNIGSFGNGWWSGQ